MNKKDLVGNKYGKLTVTKMLYNYNDTKRTKCLCDCDCGKQNILREPYALEHASYSSCGCGRKDYIIKSCGKDIVGQRFGRLLVLDILWEEDPPKVRCLCDCGKVVILIKKDVQSGHTKSCGCLKSEIFKELNNVDYTNIISDYGIIIRRKVRKNDKGQSLWECECFCGKIFIDIPARIMNGHVRSCGCLKQSAREMLIENFLKDNNIQYIPQYSFPDLKSNKNYVLHFDFAIFVNNIIKLIEYDGEQHFYPIDFFGGEECFKEAKERDILKNEYCKRNNINLLRLNYLMSEQEIRDKIRNIIYP